MTKTMVRVCRRVVAMACLGILGGSASMVAAQVIEVDVAGGRRFDRGIFGYNAHASSYYSEGYGAAYEKDLRVIRRTSIRGPAGGINADSYNWKLRESSGGGFQRPDGQVARGQSTLEMMRVARDNGSSLVFTVNQRGLGPDNAKGKADHANANPNASTSMKILASMAADWVRYTSRIVQTYRQGDEITDPEDRRVLDEVDWNGPDFRSDKLLAPGEAAVPKVIYWEIGNEVNFFDDPETYRAGYHEITTAMLAVDPTIKVGPNVTGGFQSGAGAAAAFLDRLLEPRERTSGPLERVDFVSYHPYGYQILSVPLADHAGIVKRLNDIKTNLRGEHNWVRERVAKAGRDADSMEYLATEWNPSTYDESWRLRQWNGLGVVESVMSFAEMGLTAANFWVWAAYIHTGAEPSQYLAFEALIQYGGDTLVESRREENLRVYVTRDGESGTVAVWGMNFLFGDPDDGPKTVRLSLKNLGFKPGSIKLMRLARREGATDLLTTSSTDPATPTVEWKTTDLAGLDPADFSLVINPAELSLLVIQPPPAK